ncbi:hypothetical protein L1987_45687 [Smallanthus sonchifolius]|uniref:Uncharacterized protein n=1 Tax=Smallanthus sonchifolius TaxID=185202 RepID=A0ACB9FXN8_9ASTR|nr:hypothetical protein L1987_45687 [Smallanthus sonchifolius]
MSSSSLIMDNSDINSRHIIDVEGNESDDHSVEDIDPQIESQNAESSLQNQRKRKRLTSKVWKSFTILEQEPNQPLYCTPM